MRTTYIFSSAAVVILLSGCTTRKSYSNQSIASYDEKLMASKSRVIVVGDIQMRSKLLRDEKSSTFTLEQWKADSLDTREISALEPLKVFTNENPNVILQMGDFAEFGNSLTLEVTDPSGKVLRYPAAYDEYKDTLAFFPESVPLYPAVGNHDTYAEVKLIGDVDASGKVTPKPPIFQIDPKLFKSSAQAGDNYRAVFPSLARADFFTVKDERTGENVKGGSYFVEEKAFCLITFQGDQLMHPVGEGLSERNKLVLSFIDKSAKKCASNKPVIVSNHFPVFSAQSVDKPVDMPEDSRRALVDVIRNNNVALFLSAHEHVYLRYLEKGLSDHGYDDWLPISTVFMAVSNFGLPTEFMLKAKQEARGLFKEGKVKLSPRLKFEPNDNLDSKVVGNGTTLAYFDEPHYAVMDIIDGRIDVQVKGFDTVNSTWKRVDSYAVVRSAVGKWALEPPRTAKTMR